MCNQYKIKIYILQSSRYQKNSNNNSIGQTDGNKLKNIEFRYYNVVGTVECRFSTKMKFKTNM